MSYQIISGVNCCSVAQLCLTFCDPMDCSMSGFPVLHNLLEFAQTHVHWIGDASHQFHILLSPSPPAFNLSWHQGLFQWVSSLHQVAKVLELLLQHQSFQWIFRIFFSFRIDWFDLIKTLHISLRLPQWLSDKEATCNARNVGSIPGSGRSPG